MRRRKFIAGFKVVGNRPPGLEVTNTRVVDIRRTRHGMFTLDRCP